MQNKGFTLIELLLVIAIILTVAALMSPVMFSVRRKALVVSCQSNQHQISTYLDIYAAANDSYVPRTIQDVEARNHQHLLLDPQSGIPSLKGLIKDIAGSDRGALKILRCPADNGSYGQDYYPTAQGVPCWKAFGQSQQVNIEMHINVDAPGYNPKGDGPMYGANPVKRESPVKPSHYMVLSDMWSHWHNGIVIDGETSGYFVNILFFDGHVGGKAFNSSLEAKRFLNKDDLKRWWIEPPPEE